MQITEIFYSIQGESSWAGSPCVFVRTTGCNLRCVWCDTEYSFYGGRTMSVAEVAAEVRKYGCKLVEITGGEPLLQKELNDLCRLLLDSGHTVLIETGGSLDISELDPRTIRIMDIKCPGSGEVERNYWPNLKHLTERDEVKFVVKDRADFDWARKVALEHHLTERCTVLFSPVWGELDLKPLAEWILADTALRGRVRLQVQLHKFIWGPNVRGV